MPDTHVYLDDLLSGVSDDVDEGIARFIELAERSRKHHMMMAWSKFSMLVTEIRCLGFIVNEHGMRPDESRCRELVEWPEPTSALVVLGPLRLPGTLDAPEHDGGATPTPSRPERAGLQVD